MKHFLLLFTSMCFVRPMNGNCGVLLYSNDKTQRIIKNFRLDSICFIPPIVFSAWINGEEIKTLEDSLFNSYIYASDEDSRIVENNLSLRCLRNFNKFFKEIPHYSISSLSDQDSIILNKELKKIEKTLKYENVDNVEVSDRLFGVLAKFPAHQYLLTDLNAFHNTSKYNFKSHTKTVFLRIQCFIVDIRSKKIVFYDNIIWKNPDDGFKKQNFKVVFNKIAEKIPLNHRQLKHMYLE